MNEWSLLILSDKKHRTLHASLLKFGPTEKDDGADHVATFIGNGVRVHVRVWGDALRDEFIRQMLRDYFGERKMWTEVNLNSDFSSAAGGLTVFKNKSTVLSTKYA